MDITQKGKSEVVKDADLAPLIVKLHALAGDGMRGMEDNLRRLSWQISSEYLLLLDRSGAFFTEAADAFNAWTVTNSGKAAFAIHVTYVAVN